MRRAVALGIVLALGACSKEGSTVVVTVDSATPVQASQLAVVVTANGRSKSFNVPVNGGSIPPDVVFAVQFAPGTTGTVQFDITTDSNPPIVISATASLAGAGRVDLPVMLSTVTVDEDLGGGGGGGGGGGAMSPDMTILPSCPGTCGNGVRDCMEGCDDGNTTAGDGCSASCNVESSEQEPNGQRNSADDYDHTPWFARISSATDRDYYSVTVPDDGGSIVVHTLDLGDNACAYNLMDTVVDIFENTTLLVSDDDSGVGKCSLAVASGLAAGDYYVRVTAADGASPTSFPYKLDISVGVCGDGEVTLGEECDDGNLIDGDGCDSSCVLDFGG